MLGGERYLTLNDGYLGLYLFSHESADLLRPFQRELEIWKRGEWDAQMNK